jgi:hypothetical protein
MDERAKNKRKLRELEQEEEEDADHDVPAGIEPEQPGQGLKRRTDEPSKKQKRDAQKAADKEEEEQDDEDEVVPENDVKLSKKEQKKAAKKEKQKEKKAEKKAKKADMSLKTDPVEEQEIANTVKDDGLDVEKSSKKSPGTSSITKSAQQAPEEATAKGKDEIMESIDFSVLSNEDEGASSSQDSNRQSPTFDTASLNTPPADQTSTSTSISSTIPPSEKPKHIKIPADTSALRARLAAKIEALRAARKADGPDGKPIRTRQELIESRRIKEAQRKAHKKELRKQARDEEARKREEALASNSPSVMSPAVELDDMTGNFAFGRVAFGDGTQLSHDLSYVLNSGHRKGPSDAKTALIKVQNQKKRLEALDEEARKDIAEKETWLTARRRIEGEKIRDDEAILKKTVKRKEAAKRKSEKAWKERSSGVEKAQRDRQKKREENIRKRREDKLLGKAGKKKGKGGGASKKKSRPGFEGSLGVGGGRRK